MKTLPPQELRDHDYADLRRQSVDMIDALVFVPLVKIIEETYGQRLALENVGEDMLLRAIHSGKLQYSGGVFSGPLNSTLSKALMSIGARFDKRTRNYRLPEIDAPRWLLDAASAYQAKAQLAHDRIKDWLDTFQAKAPIEIGQRSLDADTTVERVADGWKDSAISLQVMPELSEKSMIDMAARLTQNVKISIVGFTGDMVKNLRYSVQQNAEQGYRYDNLVDIVRQYKGVSDRRAEFIARQETSLFMANFRRSQFAQVGLRYYIWDSSKDARVRPGHRALDGKMFSYDGKAPAANMSVGVPCNPGEDFNCRCVDRPVVTADYEEYQRRLHAGSL